MPYIANAPFVAGTLRGQDIRAASPPGAEPQIVLTDLLMAVSPDVDPEIARLDGLRAIRRDVPRVELQDGRHVVFTPDLTRGWLTMLERDRAAHGTANRIVEPRKSDRAEIEAIIAGAGNRAT